MLIALIFILILFIIFIVGFLHHLLYLEKTKQSLSITECVSVIIIIFLLGFLSGSAVTSMSIPTIEDYIHGNVEITIEQTVKNGEVIKQDTVYRNL